MKGHSIEKEIGIDGLLAMRESGMSNAEIAAAIDVSVQSILRLIGKQPAGLRKPRKKKDVPLPPVEVRETAPRPVIPFSERLAASRAISELKTDQAPAAAPEPEWTEGFKVMARKIKAESATARYVIDGIAHTVTMTHKSPQSVMEFTAEDLAAYIDELMNVLDLMGGEAR